MSTARLYRLHFFSGLIIAAFTGAHLFNHFFSFCGADAHIAVMDTLRLVYRHIAAETVLIVAVLIQVVSGLSIYRKRRQLVKTGWEILHLYSGLYLAFFLLLHVSAILTGRLYFKLDTNFYFGVAGLSTFPFYFFFIPYYLLAIAAFFGHIAAIHHRKMKRAVLGLSPSTQSTGILVSGIIVAAVLIVGLTNEFRGFEIPVEYYRTLGITR